MPSRLRTYAGVAVLVAIAVASVVVASVFHPSVTGAASARAKPNVVLVLVDDARVDDLSTMPLVRTLIGEAGATFTDATSPLPLCCPARVTLLSGQYAHNHGVLTNKAPQGGFARFEDADTLATSLTPDYTTGLIGKYLNQYLPPYAPPGWDQWMVPVAPYNSRGWNWIVNGERMTFAGYQTNTVAALATNFITAHADDDQPFFLYTSIVAPHISSPPERDDPKVVYGTSRFPTPNVRDTYRDSFAGMANSNPAFNEADVSDKPRQPPRLKPWEIDALTEVNSQRREAMLSAQDATVNIIDTLSSTGALANTYVFFLSDNGYILGEHRYRGGKLFPYEVSIKVPMLLRGPGIPPGSVVRQTVGLQDFAPTVLAMTGESAGGERLDGVNLLPMVTDRTRHANRPILLEAAGSSTCSTKEHGYCPFRWHGILARLDGTRWKYVARGNGFEELYDLSHDPGELVNIADDARFADVRARLAALLTQYEWCAGAQCR